MTWVQIDDGILDNPKIAGVGPIGFALHVAAIAYCSRNLTDGFVPFGKARVLLATSWVDPCVAEERVWSLGRVCGMVGQDGDEVIEATISALVAAQLWEQTTSGYHIHDYEEHQRTADQVAEIREARRRAGQRSGEARRASRMHTSEHGVQQTSNKGGTECSTHVQQPVEQNANKTPTRVQRTELTPLSPNGDIPPTLTLVVNEPQATSNGRGTKHRPPGKGEPTSEVLAAFTAAWNRACAPLPVLRKPPQSLDNRRLVRQAWEAADGDEELLVRAIRLFALDPWHRERGYGFATFCRHADHWVGKAATAPVTASAASSWDS